jgi:3'-5' exonuclease
MLSSTRKDARDGTKPGSSGDSPTNINTLLKPLHSLLDTIIAVFTFLQHSITAGLTSPSLQPSFSTSGLLSSLPSWPWPAPSSSRKSRREYWTYRTGRDWRTTPQVRVCTDLSTSNAVAALFLEEEVLGFDLEWKPGASNSSSIQSNISMIQVAKPDLIALFHLGRFSGSSPPDFLAPNLRRLIESPHIFKTGVNIAGDCTRLHRHLDVDPQGIIELSSIYRLVKYSNGDLDDIRKINKTLVSLAAQVEEHLGLPLFKGFDVRTSDWSQPLSAKQTLYAASDAYACLRLWQVLDGKRKALDPPPPRPAPHELKQPILLANGQTVAEYLDAQKVDAEIVAEIMRRDSDAEESEGESEAETKSDDEDVMELGSESEHSADHKASSSSSASTPALSPTDATALEKGSEWASTTLASLTTAPTAPAASSPNTQRLPSKRHLQAYHLYHEQALALTDAAKALNIKPSSAACYVLEAITAAKLPYEKERLDSEVLGKVPPQVVRGRFWMFKK